MSDPSDILGRMQREQARKPEDLSRLFVRWANAGDVDGLVGLYEPNAVLSLPQGRTAVGVQAIREFYESMLADRPVFAEGDQRPALRNGNLALTSTRLVDGGVTAEVARRQPDGTWRWLLDEPSIVAAG